jgi:hypothetical protein
MWCLFVTHAPPEAPQKDKEQQKQTDIPVRDQVLLVIATAMITLLICYYCSPPQAQQPAEAAVPAATLPKSERRGTIHSPTRRNSAEERQDTAAADEDQPAAAVVLAAPAAQAHLADAPLLAPIEAAPEEGNEVHPPEHAGVLQDDEAHDVDPDAIAAGPLDARPAELPGDDEAELDASASHGPNAAAAEVDYEAAADGSPQLGSILGPAAALNDELSVGAIADCAVATSTQRIPIPAAASTAAVELEHAGPMRPGSVARQLEERETHNSSSSAELDAATVGPPVLPRTSSASRSLAVDVHQGADSSGDVAAAELLILPGSSFALTASLLGPSAAGVATAGTAQQRILPDGDDLLHTTAAPTSPIVAATAPTDDEGAEAESAASDSGVAMYVGEFSDRDNDAEAQEQELSTTGGSAVAPPSPLSRVTGSAAFPGAAAEDSDDDGDYLSGYNEPALTPAQVRALYGAVDEHLYMDAIELFGLKAIRSEPQLTKVKTLRKRLSFDIEFFLEDLNIINGGALPLHHVQLHPALASAPAAPTVAAPQAAAPQAALQAAAAPEEGGWVFPHEVLPPLLESEDSDVDSDVDSDREGDTPHALLEDDSCGDAPSDASTAASAGAATATTGRTAVARGVSTSPAQRVVASDLGNDISADVAQGMLAEHTGNAAAPTRPTGTTATTTASRRANTAVPLVQPPAAVQATVNGNADVAADVALQTRLAELKAEYLAAVNQGLTTAELRELAALPDGIKAAWERAASSGNAQLFWADPSNTHKYEAELDERFTELKRAHKHLRGTTLTAADLHWEAVAAGVTARTARTAQLCGMSAQASLAAVLSTLKSVQYAAVTALMLDGFEATAEHKSCLYRYGHYLSVPTAPAPPRTSSIRELSLADYDNAAQLFHIVL